MSETGIGKQAKDVGEDIGQERFARVCQTLDDNHAGDPRRIVWNGTEQPRAVVYHGRMAHWIDRTTERPSDVLRLAARAQHVGRWTSLRADYPQGRAGYKAWRRDLAVLHAKVCGAAMLEAGYSTLDAERAGEILRKLKLTRDAEVQALEDAACLTFLELDLVPFMGKHERAKVIDIVVKTWGKMSERGHTLALELSADLPTQAQSLLTEALTPSAG